MRQLLASAHAGMATYLLHLEDGFVLGLHTLQVSWLRELVADG